MHTFSPGMGSTCSFHQRITPEKKDGSNSALKLGNMSCGSTFPDSLQCPKHCPVVQFGIIRTYCCAWRCVDVSVVGPYMQGILFCESDDLWGLSKTKRTISKCDAPYCANLWDVACLSIQFLRLPNHSAVLNGSFYTLWNRTVKISEPRISMSFCYYAKKYEKTKDSWINYNLCF